MKLRQEKRERMVSARRLLLQTTNIHAEMRNLSGNVREMTPDDKEQIKSELPTAKTASTVAQQVRVWLKSLPLTDF